MITPPSRYTGYVAAILAIPIIGEKLNCKWLRMFITIIGIMVLAVGKSAV